MTTNERLDFGGDPKHNADSGIFERKFYHCEIGATVGLDGGLRFPSASFSTNFYYLTAFFYVQTSVSMATIKTALTHVYSTYESDPVSLNLTDRAYVVRKRTIQKYIGTNF